MDARRIDRHHEDRTLSIARRAAPLLFSFLLLGLAGAAAGDEPPAAQPTAAPEDAASPAPAADAAPTAAEPVPPAPAVPPVMPATVVRPVTPRSVSLGRHGVIELGRPATAASRWHGFPISLSLRDAPLPEVLRSFARLAGVNLVLSPGVTGSVTVELEDVPWDQALSVILKTHGMAAEIDGRVWSVKPH